MLPEFTNRRALPASAGFGAAFERGNQVRKVLANVGCDRGAGTAEVELTSQFIGQQGKVKRLAVRQNFGQKIVSGLGPRFLRLPPEAIGAKAGFVTEPLMTKAIELSRTDTQTLRGRKRVEFAGVEGGKNFLNVESWNAMNELFFS